MRKGQEKLLAKAQGMENIRLLEDESKTLKELQELYYFLRDYIDFPASEELVSALRKCKLRNTYKITEDLEGIKDKTIINLYKAMTGIDWDYLPNPDNDFYFLSLINDLSDRERVNRFLDFINDGIEYWFGGEIEKVAFLFNNTDLHVPSEKDLNLRCMTSRYNPMASFYHNFNNKWIYPEEIRDVFKENKGYDLLLSVSNKTVKMLLENKSISMIWTEYKNISTSHYFSPEYNNHFITRGSCYICPGDYLRSIQLIVWTDGGICEVLKNKKLGDRVIPLTLKKAREYAEESDDLKMFITTYLNTQNSYMAKDLLALPRVPISINEALKYNSLKEMMIKHYKDGHLINWSRVDIDTGYAVLKCLKKVTNPNILLDMLYKKELSIAENYNEKQLIRKTLYDALMLRHESLNDVLAEDYINMSLRRKRKINLQFGIRRIAREHDLMIDEAMYSRVPNIKIPKNSKFNKLKLPNDFVRIQTKKRLIQESKEMHHCVATYGSRINNDECAIYHLDGFNKPWTIEIRHDKSGFYINQIQTIGNADIDNTEVTKYVQNCIRGVIR